MRDVSSFFKFNTILQLSPEIKTIECGSSLNNGMREIKYITLALVTTNTKYEKSGWGCIFCNYSA